MGQEHMRSEYELEHFEKNYLPSGFAWIVVFIIGVFCMADNKEIFGVALMVVAMLGFVLRRLRIEGEKTRDVLRGR